MTTLVTGATGFVGRHLVAHLGAEAVPLTRADADLRHPLPPLPRVDTVVHSAAIIDGDMAAIRAVNIDATARLLEWAVATGVQRFVFVSTAGVLLTTDYAQTKRDAEAIVRGAPIDVQIVRLFFPYGPGQTQPRLIPRLIASVREGRPLQIDPDGGPTLSLTYIDDVTEAMARIARLDGSHLLDLGGEAIRIRDLGELIGRVVGATPTFAFRDTPGTDLIADATETWRLLDYQPRVSIEEGIRRTCA